MYPFLSLEGSRQAARYDHVVAIFSLYKKAYLQMLSTLKDNVGKPLTRAVLEQLDNDIHKLFCQVKQLHHRDDDSVCQVPEFTLARVGSDLRVLPRNAIAHCLALIVNQEIEKGQSGDEDLEVKDN